MTFELARILHAGYVVRAGGATIALDPIFEVPFSVNAYPFPACRFDLDAVRALRLDAIFISHHHDDHLSLESLAHLDRATPVYLYALDETYHALVRALGFATVHALALDEPVTIERLTVTPRPALDVDVDAIFDLEADGLRVLDVGDAWIDPETLDKLAARAPWDVVLWPFQTMREVEVLSPSRAAPADRGLPLEWGPQLRALAPRVVVPSACQLTFEPWSWYRRAFFPISYRRFEAEVRALLPAADVVRLDPGRALVVDAHGHSAGAPLAWVTPDGPQDVDYTYAPPAPAPSTASIARHLPRPEPSAHARALRFCLEGLARRHAALPPIEDGYFASARRWRLVLFDADGAPWSFDYLVRPDTITALSVDDARPLAWQTELPLVKLVGALEDGETSTSMYLRINDRRFDDAVERALVDVDVHEDPLLRVLFAGRGAGYQRAQLARLTGASR
jgi:L-ascorbate metabolism protein UlaG (beta-lactamase superfamily)